jgi:hypothetical protein
MCSFSVVVIHNPGITGGKNKTRRRFRRVSKNSLTVKPFGNPAGAERHATPHISVRQRPSSAWRILRTSAAILRELFWPVNAFYSLRTGSSHII